MKQEINLYRPIFRRQEKKFSARAMFQAGMAVFVGVALIYGLLFWHVRGLRAEAHDAQQRVALATKRLDEIARRIGPGAKSQLLEQEVAKLEQRVAARLRLEELLARGMFSNTTGYSEFFVAFARQHVPGVWLTGFNIVGAGENMRLQGRATEPSRVPRYVQRLAAEETLAGREFQVFLMSRPAAGAQTAAPRYVEFLFRTARKKEGS